MSGFFKMPKIYVSRKWYKFYFFFVFYSRLSAHAFDKVKGLKSIRICPVVEGENQYSTLLRSPAPLFPTMITSKIALEKIGYRDEQVPSFQEWDTSIRLAKYCRIIHLKEPLMVYHVGSGDAISGSVTKHVEGLHYIISKYESDINISCDFAPDLFVDSFCCGLIKILSDLDKPESIHDPVVPEKKLYISLELFFIHLLENVKIHGSLFLDRRNIFYIWPFDFLPFEGQRFYPQHFVVGLLLVFIFFITCCIFSTKPLCYITILNFSNEIP